MTEISAEKEVIGVNHDGDCPAKELLVLVEPVTGWYCEKHGVWIEDEPNDSMKPVCHHSGCGAMAGPYQGTVTLILDEGETNNG